jgi:hypothetical protein
MKETELKPCPFCGGEPIVDYICISFDELAELKKKYTEDNKE